MNNINTIFILGYPRSGTTWFANLFNSHPDITYRHEMIGRCYTFFPESLFKSLKYNNGLTDEEYSQAMKIILDPNIASDRPPFFHKNHLRINSIRLHYLAWLACRASKLLNPVYRILFQPKKQALTLAVKETRSSVNMDSILTSIRADQVVILFRHPCGALASILSGIRTGKMSKSTDEMRISWFAENRDKPYIKSLALGKSEILNLPEHEYLAILWRHQNEGYLSSTSDQYHKTFINYENFMDNREMNTLKLFEQLSLSFDPNVEKFIKLSSGSNSKPIIKDSSSNFYSVYRNKQFDPHAWKKTLSKEQIAIIEKHTLNTFERLLRKHRG